MQPRNEGPKFGTFTKGRDPYFEEVGAVVKGVTRPDAGCGLRASERGA